MEHDTRKNAALVEEMSATATNLRGQAGELLEAVSVFIVGKVSNNGPVKMTRTIRQRFSW